MNLKQLFSHHWEKVGALLIAGVCAWGLVETARLLAGQVGEGEVEETTGKIRKALKTLTPTPETYVYASSPRDHSADIDSTLACIGYARGTIGAITPHMFHRLAPKPEREFITVDQVRPYFAAPVLESVTATRGRIEVVLSQNPEDAYIKAVRFELFRKEEGGDYGEEPFSVLDAEQRRPAAGGRRAREETPAIDLHGRPRSTATATFEDKDVEPKRSYTYKVRTVGVADVPQAEKAEEKPEDTSDEPVPVHRVGARPAEPRTRKKVEIIPPIGVDEIRLDGKVAWVTPFSSEKSAKTPTNVELELASIVGEYPDWAARIKIRQWNRKIDDWDVGTFSIEEGKPIEGRKTIRYESGQQRVKFDSGYVLLKIERVTEKITRMKKVPRQQPDGTIIVVEEEVPIELEVPQVTVKELSTEKIESIRPKKEEERVTEEEEKPKDWSPYIPRAGGRRRRRKTEEKED